MSNIITDIDITEEDDAFEIEGDAIAGSTYLMYGKLRIRMTMANMINLKAVVRDFFGEGNES